MDDRWRMRTPTGGVVRSILLSSVVVAGVVGCGSDDESGEPAPVESESGDGDASDTDTDAVDAPAAAPEESGGGGEGTATLTMVDGTAYVFEMTTCDTSNTDDFAIPDSYDLFGRTADGEFVFQLTRAGLDEDFITQVGSLEGDFDDEGKNNNMLYTADLGTEPLTVDGAIVSGSFMMSAIGPTRPHGDEVAVILDARC
jgi:hypothetical protein